MSGYYDHYSLPFRSEMIEENGEPLTIIEVPVTTIDPASVDNLRACMENCFVNFEAADVEMFIEQMFKRDLANFVVGRMQHYTKPQTKATR
jgi:hypothetical protein